MDSGTIVLFITFAVVVLMITAKIMIPAARRARIYGKYGRTEVADRLIERTVWVGETAEQLQDSIGVPADIDDKVFKTKRRETWKYVRRGRNRYGLRITVENGIVVGWDEKL
jgi:hypothetical protein